MTYANAFSTIRSRAGLPLATIGAALLIAGCGSSGSGSTITIGAENSSDSALAKSDATSSTGTSSTSSTSSTASATTPTSGPLSKAPTLTPPSGAAPKTLVIHDLIKGTGKEVTSPSQSVTVNYTGVLFHGGKEFDSSWKRKEPATFPLTGVIPGWTKGIPGMKVGGRRELVIPSALAYGPSGRPPSIQANAPLVFVIDLLGA